MLTYFEAELGVELGNEEVFPLRIVHPAWGVEQRNLPESFLLF